MLLFRGSRIMLDRRATLTLEHARQRSKPGSGASLAAEQAWQWSNPGSGASLDAALLPMHAAHGDAESQNGT